MAGLDPAIHAMTMPQSTPLYGCGRGRWAVNLHRHGMDRRVEPDDDGGVMTE
jgi:hypothetical protein